jgi:hypothetical protein
MQREEAAKRVMRVAESTGEAEEELAAALQSRTGIAAGGRLPPQGAVEATEEVAEGKPLTSAGYTPRQQIRRMLQQSMQGSGREESADTGKQDAVYPQEEQDTDPAVQLQFEQLQQDMRNAAMLEVVTVGLREMQAQLKHRSEWAVRRDRAAQTTAAAGADAEQAAEVEQMYREILQNTQGIGSGRQHQMTVAQQAGYYGSQPGQSVVRATAEGNRKQRAPTQATAQIGGSSSKRAKARQSVAGVDVGNNRVAKNRRESDLSVEKPEVVTLRLGPALEQAERWVEQWDRLQSRSSSRHLRVSTPASSSEGKWRQGVWARQ